MKKMVDMRISDEEKREKMADVMPVDPTAGPDYPWGLCIRLSERELDKLGLDGDCEVGDVLDMRCMAEVTSVSARKSGGERCCEVELQITHIDPKEDDDEGEEDE